MNVVGLVKGAIMVEFTWYRCRMPKVSSNSPSILSYFAQKLGLGKLSFGS